MSELNLLLRNSDMPCGATALTAQVLNRTDATFYYEDCPHHLPGRYITADPVLDCVCQRDPSDQWCQSVYSTVDFHSLLC